MQKIKAPMSHSQPHQLIRRPLPPTHPFSGPDDGSGYRQPMYNVPRSLQSQAFMVSGADYPNRQLQSPPTDSTHSGSGGVTSSSHLYSPQDYSFPHQRPPLPPSTIHSQTEQGQGVDENQQNSFLKPLVKKFRQIFHPGQGGGMVDPQQQHQGEEYLQTSFGIPQHPSYGTPASAASSRYSSSSTSSMMSPYHNSYPTQYSGHEMYHTHQSAVPPPSLTQPGHQFSNIPFPPSTTQQDNLSIFSLAHIPETQLPNPTSSPASSHPGPGLSYQTVSSQAEENLWLSKVSQPLDPTQRKEPLDQKTEEQQSSAELLALSNSLNDLSVAAVPYVYQEPN
jgi:hypothetical protein